MLNIYNAGAELPDVLPRNSIVHRPYQNASAHIASESVDLVLIDPPYTDGVTDALPNHKIQTKFDINHVISEAYRILKPDGFFVFFGQMPTVLAWLNSATAVFRYKEHITWCKRNITSPYLDIQRSKEEIFIYCKGKPKYHETQAKYEDLKTPALHLGIYELSTIKSIISDLQRRCIDNAYNMKYFSGVPEKSDNINPKQDGQILDDTANNDIWRAKKLDKAERKNEDMQRHKQSKSDFEDASRENQKQVHHKELRAGMNFNDDFYKKKYPTRRYDYGKSDFEKLAKSSCKGGQIGYQDPASNDAVYNKGREIKSSFRYVSKHWCNLTNVWAFMPTKERATSYSQLKKRTKRVPPIWSYKPQNQTKMGADGENWKHPTVKPVLLLERLIKLLTPEPTEDYTPLIVDFFGGSGTTFLGSLSTKRDCIIFEKFREYVDMTVHRSRLILGQNSIENHQPQTALPATTQPPKPKFIQQNMFD